MTLEIETQTGRPGRGVRHAARRATEARILDAAALMFSQAGYDGATMAEIAEKAELPKANVHYYFKSKARLYTQVLARIHDTWLDQLGALTADQDPATALKRYIYAKVELSRLYPVPSRVFANELLHGAPFLGPELATKLRREVDRVAQVFDAWRAAGQIRPVDARHLLITLWAATQTYADFEVQIDAVLGATAGDEAVFRTGAKQLADIVLRGLGLQVPPE